MAKYKCTVCGHIYDEEVEGVKFADLPADWKCPTCKQPKDKFVLVDETAERQWAAEHVVGVAKGVDPEIIEGLRANFEGECSEVGMYYRQAAFEEADHASRFAELLGEVVTDSTKKNLELRIEAEYGATEGKFELAKKAKQQNLDAIHDTVHEMARDEARHGKAFEGLLKRYFGE